MDSSAVSSAPFKSDLKIANDLTLLQRANALNSAQEGTVRGDLAPVVVYTYNRVNHLKQTIAALQQNYLACKTVLYVVSDGPKTEAHKTLVYELREYVDSVIGFREVVRVYRNKNFGMLASIMEAEEQVINDHGSVISMEDDNVSSKNYLDFMNGGLKSYSDDPKVFSICGYCPPITVPPKFSSEYWFHRWNLSWGYALWKHKYYKIYPLKNPYVKFKREGVLRKIRSAGGLCIADALRLDYRRKRVFPDAILCAKMIEGGLVSVLPAVSKIRNIGSDGSGVSASTLASRFDVKLDHRPVTDFAFGGKPEMNENLANETAKFYNSGVLTRLARYMGVYHELSAFKYGLKNKLTNA
jgi:hypothetical protein